MKSLILIFLALLLASSAGQGQLNNTSFDEHISSALRSLVVDSSTSIESYRFFMDMEQNIELANLSTEEIQQIYSRSIGFGMANMTDRALKLSLASLTYDENDVANSSSIAIEEYLKNDTIYMKMDGNWTALKMPLVADAWSQQNTMNQQLNMFNQSRLTLMGSEMAGDEDCYKIQADMNLSAIADQLSQQTSSVIPIEDMNYAGLFTNMSLGATYWVTKSDHHLKKSEIMQIYTLSPSSLGLEDSQSGELEMRIKSRVTMLFSDYNESMSIELPADAKNAEAFSAGLMESAEAVPIDSPENETALNETAISPQINESNSGNESV
jgi:hypothetical protein